MNTAGCKGQYRVWKSKSNPYTPGQLGIVKGKQILSSIQCTVQFTLLDKGVNTDPGRSEKGKR